MYKTYCSRGNLRGAITFGQFLLKLGQYPHLLQFVKLLDSKTPELLHLLGMAFLNTGEIEKSTQCFYQVAESISGKSEYSTHSHFADLLADPEKSKFFRDLVDHKDQDSMFNSPLVVKYYIYIMGQLELHQQHALLIEFALAAISHVESYEDARSANPDLVIVYFLDFSFL